MSLYPNVQSPDDKPAVVAARTAYDELTDALNILKKVVGKIDKFPVEQA